MEEVTQHSQYILFNYVNFPGTEGKYEITATVYLCCLGTVDQRLR